MNITFRVDVEGRRRAALDVTNGNSGDGDGGGGGGSGVGRGGGNVSGSGGSGGDGTAIVNDAVLRRSFDSFDKDGSGNLDSFQLGPALVEVLGRDVSTQLVNGLLGTYAQEGTNRVTFDSFMVMVESAASIISGGQDVGTGVLCCVVLCCVVLCLCLCLCLCACL